MATTLTPTPAPTPAPVGMMGPAPLGTTVNTSLSGGQYLTGDPADLARMTNEQSGNVLATSGAGFDYNTWKNGPTYAADVASAQAFLDSRAAAPAPMSAQTYNGMMGSEAPAPTPAPLTPQSAPVAAAPATTATGSADPADYTAQAAQLYSSILGREGDAEGVNFWASQLAAGKSLDDVTQSFKASARTVLNNYLTSGQSPYADLLGQDLREGATAGSFTGSQFDNARAGLSQRVFTNLYGPQPTPEPRLVTPDTPYGQLQQQYAPNLNRQIDARNETIEGRINNLMAQDQLGNYTNPVVRQAVDRALQSFASRGLLNTSMAVQAGQEAAIAKAIEIAGPDAERYFQQGRANQDAQNVFARDETQQSYTERNNLAEWAQQDKTVANDQAFRERILTTEQSFTLRQNYIEANDNANARFNAAVNNINASNMTPADKSVAIAQATAVRDGDLAYNNNLFAAQPGFAREWLAIATPAAADIGSITNPDVLANIINDPAQPAAVREAARAKLAQLQQNPTPAPTTAPVAAPSGEVAV